MHINILDFTKRTESQINKANEQKTSEKQQRQSQASTAETLLIDDSKQNLLTLKKFEEETKHWGTLKQELESEESKVTHQNLAQPTAYILNNLLVRTSKSLQQVILKEDYAKNLFWMKLESYK